jgi:predicted nuclease of predicted toxin-antitoxin system
VLITYDKDFGELAVLGGADHSGIIRLVVMPLAAQVQACQLILANHGPALLSGAIATAERGRIRIRMAADETAD